MGLHLKPYPEYRGSKVPWLATAPEHWGELPMFAVYTPRQVKNVGLREMTVLSLSYGNIVVKPADKLHGLVPESFEGYQLIEPGDIIVRTTDLQNDRTSLRVGFSKHKGIITSAYLCLRTRGDMSPAYGYLLLNAYDLLKMLYGFGSGLRQSLEFDHIKRVPALIPPPTEQAAITKYVEHADRQIRHAIATKRKLISVLNEQRRNVIRLAVRRGIDHSALLVDSGIASVGKVPSHWRLSRLKNELSCLNSHRVPLSATERGKMQRRTYDYYG